MVARVIPTKVHGVVDYATSGALLAAPEVLRLNDVRSSALAPRVTGAATTGLSALTDYELGAVRAIPMKAHLAADAVAGALLAASPWVVGYRKQGLRHWLPHTLVGLSEVALALTTKPEDGRDTSRTRRRAAIAGIATLALAVPVAAGIGLWRRRSNGSGDGETFSSDAKASTGDPAS